MELVRNFRKAFLVLEEMSTVSVRIRHLKSELVPISFARNIPVFTQV